MASQMDRAVRLYEEGGLSVAAISRRLGISPRTIRRNLRASGVILRGPGAYPKPLSPEEVRRAVLLYKRGYTTKQIRSILHHGMEKTSNAIRSGTEMRLKGARRLPGWDLSHVSTDQWIFLAGLFEGEGCIKGVRPNKKNHHYRVQLTLTQVDPTLPFWIRFYLWRQRIPQKKTTRPPSIPLEKYLYG